MMNNTVEQTGGSIVISMVCKLLLLNELCTIMVGNANDNGQYHSAH